MTLKKPEDFEFVKGARLCRKNLQCADVTEAFLVKADISGSSLWGAKLDRADLRYAIFSTLEVKHKPTLWDIHYLNEMPSEDQDEIVDIIDFSLRYDQAVEAFYAPFSVGTFNSAHLEHALLRGAKLEHSILVGVDLMNANLTFAKLHGADLRCANLYRARLNAADLTDAQLRNANLKEADLKMADLTGADLRLVKGLSKAQLRHAIIDPNTTRLPFDLLYRADIEVSGTIPPGHHKEIPARILNASLEEGVCVIVGYIVNGGEATDQVGRSKALDVEYSVRVKKCIIADDLITTATEGAKMTVFAPSRWKDLLLPGRTYIMPVTRRSYSAYSYIWQPRYAKDVSRDLSGKKVESFAEEAEKKYIGTAIHKFRNQTIDPNVALPKLDDELKKACSDFRDSPKDRCTSAKRIAGSIIDLDYPTKIVPKVYLSKSQSIRLLGKPTAKIGWSCIYSCGEDKSQESERRLWGILTVNFDKSSRVKNIRYSTREWQDSRRAF
ncbi:MAG: pentapeptide repeat-containing protein [Planctomycetota bacterium]